MGKDYSELCDSELACGGGVGGGVGWKMERWGVGMGGRKCVCVSTWKAGPALLAFGQIFTVLEGQSHWGGFLKFSFSLVNCFHTTPLRILPAPPLTPPPLPTTSYTHIHTPFKSPSGFDLFSKTGPSGPPSYRM